MKINRTFQLSKKSWICDRIFDAVDHKVRNHCDITGKYRGFAPWSCNVDLKLAKKVPVKFHDLRGYHNHLIMQEINKFNVKLNVISIGLEKMHGFCD